MLREDCPAWILEDRTHYRSPYPMESMGNLAPICFPSVDDIHHLTCRSWNMGLSDNLLTLLSRVRTIGEHSSCWHTYSASPDWGDYTELIRLL